MNTSTSDPLAGVTACLNYLALERNVSGATQKQALNAMDFLLRQVFGLGEFVLGKPNPGHSRRRPPTVLTAPSTSPDSLAPPQVHISNTPIRISSIALDKSLCGPYQAHTNGQGQIAPFRVAFAGVR